MKNIIIAQQYNYYITYFNGQATIHDINYKRNIKLIKESGDWCDLLFKVRVPHVSYRPTLHNTQTYKAHSARLIGNSSYVSIKNQYLSPNSIGEGNEELVLEIEVSSNRSSGSNTIEIEVEY